MVRLRQAKVDGIAATSRRSRSTTPAATARRARARLGLDVRPDRRRRCGGSARQGMQVAHAHLRHLNPFPANTRRGAARATDKVLVPEMNLGQLALLLRAKYLVDAIGYNQVRGLPFMAARARRRSSSDVITSMSESMRHCGPRPARPLAARARRPTAQADGQGLQDRPGGPLVPGLRRLRHPRRRAGLHARARAARARTSSSSPASAARRGSRTTWTPTACTPSTAARRRSPPAWRSSRPDLSVWVVTGDGDALSIGGNHLIHALRRNVNLKILLFNNRIYGLTKGQYSPTSRAGQGHQVHPDGLGRHPVQPGLARARRRGDLRRPHDRLRPQAPHRGAAARRPRTAGTALVEIYQNCNDLQRRRVRRAQGRRRPATTR